MRSPSATGALDERGMLDILGRILTDLPRLDGPCRGHPELFDARGPDESPAGAERRHAQAISLCRRCPALDACRAFSEGERDVGMVRAGQIPNNARRERAS